MSPRYTISEMLNMEFETLKAEIMRLRAELAAEHEKHRMIPVTEKLPDKDTTDIGEEYLCIVGYPFNRVMPLSYIQERFYSGHAFCSTDWTKRVTHWQPLPKAEEEE